MKIEVTFELELPDNINDEDVAEWLEFELNYNGQMNSKNPLAKTLLEPLQYTLDWEHR
jgi:hypothetical protein